MREQFQQLHSNHDNLDFDKDYIDLNPIPTQKEVEAWILEQRKAELTKRYL